MAAVVSFVFYYAAGPISGQRRSPATRTAADYIMMFIIIIIIIITITTGLWCMMNKYNTNKWMNEMNDWINEPNSEWNN